MSIQTTTTRRDDGDPQQPSAEHTLRQRLAALIHERDFWQGIAEGKGNKLDKLQARHRYSLAIHCDAKGCEAAVSVSSARAPDDGLLARGLIMAAVGMRWRMGPQTTEAMRALAVDAAPMIVSASSDQCPDHHEGP